MKVHGEDGAKIFDENLRHRLKFLDFAPILHISALTGERAPKLLETIEKVSAARATRVPTGALNRFIEQITRAHPPVSSARRNVRILYAAQTSVAPPTFVLFTNVATELHFSYLRFLENRLREEYGFYGTPIRVTIRRRKEHRGRGKGESKSAAQKAAAAPAPTVEPAAARKTARPRIVLGQGRSPAGGAGKARTTSGSAARATTGAAKAPASRRRTERALTKRESRGGAGGHSARGVRAVKRGNKK